MSETKEEEHESEHEAPVEQEKDAKPKEVLKKPLTAYFLFMREVREDVKRELAASGERCGIGEVSKMCGKRWTALDKAEKERFQTTARLMKQEYKEAVAKLRALGIKVSTKKAKKAKSSSVGLPIATVKRLILMDADAHRITREAVLVSSQAAELFLQWLAGRCQYESAANGRRTIGIADLKKIVNHADRLEFLRGSLPRTKAKEPGKGEKRKKPPSTKPKQSKRKKKA